MRRGQRSLIGRGTLAAGFAVTLALGLAAPGVQAANGAKGKKPVVMHGYTCTKLAKKKHQTVIGVNGDVVCGLRAGVRLVASGAGHVVLIAGPGAETLVGSSTPGASDTLIGGTGDDTIKAGSAGDDVIETGSGSDSIDCGTGTAQVSIVGATSNDAESPDCQGSNVSQPSVEMHGTVASVASDGSSMTVTYGGAQDTFQAWLTANGNPASVPVVITPTTTIEREGGGTITSGDYVELTALTSSSTLAGSTLSAVDVQAQPNGQE